MIARYKYHLYTFFIYLIIFSWAAQQFANTVGYVFWNYDSDSSDGDFLNIVTRLAHKLPIYSDWSQGIFLNIYPPLYHFVLLIGHFLGVDVISFGRLVNILFFMMAYLLMILIIRQIFKHSKFCLLLMAAAGGIMMMAGGLYSWEITYLRSDPLLFFLQVLGLYLLISYPKQVKLIALLAVMAPLAKQTGIVLSVTIFIYYLWVQRTSLLKYILWVLIYAIPIIFTLEIYNQGQFLNSVLFNISKNYTGFMQWKFLFVLLSNFYQRFMWAIILVPIGIYYILKSKNRNEKLPLVIMYGIDLLLLIKIGRNTGGGYSYYYLHWVLTALLSTVGGFFLFLKLLDRVRALNLMKGKKVFTVEWMVVGLSLIVILKGIHDLKPNKYYRNYLNTRQEVDHFLPLMQDLERTVKKISLAHPHARWLTNRNSSAVVRAGNILEQEMGSLYFAIRNKNVNIKKFRELLLNGHYQFLQGGIYLSRNIYGEENSDLDSLAEVVASCFHRVAAGKFAIYINRPLSGDIYIDEYDGNIDRCQSLKNRN